MKSKLLASSLMALALIPMAATTVSQTANAATQQPAIVQKQALRVDPRFAGYPNVDSIEYRSGVVQVIYAPGLLLYALDLNNNRVKVLPQNSKWYFDSIYHMTDGQLYYHIGNNTFAPDENVFETY